MSENSKKHRRKYGIHLIASDINHVFEYQAFCKITITRVQSMLFVEPINEEFKLISAMFKWKFYAQKNILFVIAENDFQDFVLVFKNEVICKKVYDLIFQKRVNDVITNEELYQRILSPMFNQIIENRFANAVISKLLLKWMNTLNVQDKEAYIQMMKGGNIYHIIFLNGESVGENHMNDETNIQGQRKRKFSKINTNDISDGESLCNDKRTCVKRHKFIKSNCQFKMVNINGTRRLLKRLLIFPSNDKRFCYEFRRSQLNPNIFYCNECEKMGIFFRAKIDQNGELQIQDKKHVCKKLQYSTEKYFDIQKIRKPNYEILENCSTNSGKVLIIFNPNNRNLCYDFRWRSNTKSFCCISCDVEAKIMNTSKENEYIEILKLNHHCKYRPYNREQYFIFNNFVLAPDFEIRSQMVKGKERKTLFIFNENDKTKCYNFRYYSGDKVFICKECPKQEVHVTAKLHQNSDGEDYLILSKKQHVCEMVKYNPQKDDEIILRQPDFKLMEETCDGVPKLFVFDSQDKNLCYIFSPVKKNYNRYICRGCHNFVERSKKTKEKLNGVVYLSLIKDENGEYIIQIKNQKHLCQPRKYEPQKYELKIADCFFYYQKKSSPKSLNVAILLSTDSTLCYPFLYSKSSNNFYCLNCEKLKKRWYMQSPKMDENGKEYFIHDQSKHSCKPVKLSTFVTPEFKRLERKDIAFEGKLKIDESRILKLPNFEFRPSRNGNPEGTLVIFDSKDNSTIYEYYYHTFKEIFVCLNCNKKNRHVTAKIHVDEKNGEKFIELSKSQHICEPKKDEFPARVIKHSNFMIVDREDGTNPAKAIVFTSKEKEFCYEFRYRTSQNLFECIQCEKLKKSVGVKLYTKENGEKCIELSKSQHICEPKKDEFPARVIKHSNFMIVDREDGTNPAKAIVFTSKEKEFCYEFRYRTSQNLFECIQCEKLKKSVGVKLYTKENGEKYLLKLKNDHICEPKKYDAQNFQNAKTVPKSMFELYQNAKGVANKRMVVFTSEKKDLIYEYSLTGNLYRCLECIRLHKYVTAKVIGENEDKYLELSKTEHICKPKKYNPKYFKK
uniref:Uncharacterized protein n=1 Tax=Panagrolaimus davidi TaxID=227884 RepID=A0A914QAE4_9BILA